MSTISNPLSFTVSFLVDKLGFSPEPALKASNYLHLKTSTNADTVISFLEEHGFSKSQIKTMIKVEPALLASNVEITFLPKLKYLLSKGFSKPDLAKVICHNPKILYRSLERQIIPFFNTYSNLIQSDEKTVKAIKAYPFLILYDTDIANSNLLANINMLRDCGVPETNIIKMLHQFPSSLLINPGRLKEVVEKLEEIEMDPLVLKFVHAVIVLARIGKSLKESKVDVFKKWGWSEEEFWEYFRKYPFFFTISTGKIMTSMDFLVNKMGFDACRVPNCANVLRFSFENRIVPRGLIAQHLLSKRLQFVFIV